MNTQKFKVGDKVRPRNCGTGRWGEVVGYDRYKWVQYKYPDGSYHSSPVSGMEGQKLQDQVNHPSHYNESGVECIEAIRATLGPDGFQAYCKGNCMKYLWRYQYKNGLEDLKKAQVYLNWMVESKEGAEE